jgi:SAM-dependent methyltransferase/alpha-beta hydrolase superfamily lysophospholipase
MIEGQLPVEVSEITSRLVSFPGPSGMQLVGYVDGGAEAVWNERVVILAPRYGETKKNNLQLAYVLVANGFKVLRFDQTNHMGDSDGTMDQFTLSGAADDILAAVDYIDRFYEPAEVVLVTLSLSARCGFRACSKDARISRFVSLVGMFDMDRTLQAIYNRDFFGELKAGATWNKVDILGFEIEGSKFYQDLVQTDMLNLSGTLADAEKVEVPVLHLRAENDLWVAHEDVDEVMSRCRSGRVMTIPDVGHEINENPEAFKFVIKEVVAFCSDGLPPSEAGVMVPAKKVLLGQNRVERKQLQESIKFTDTEGEFWGEYLGKFGIIEDAKYYVEYFGKMAELLGGVQSNDVLLDAGCGNGFFGISIIRSLIHNLSAKKVFPHPIHYCGVDFTSCGLSRSYSRHVPELIDLHQQLSSEFREIAYSYRKLDFDSVGGANGGRLPFADGSLDKICCSLVLSYLKDPLSLMQEFYRILRPGGVAVVSSMKPGCDMTVLYHSYVTQGSEAKTELEAGNEQDASGLLSAAGRIKLKRDAGVYQFFEFEELEQLAALSGFENTRSCRSFGNQANLIRLVK